MYWAESSVEQHLTLFKYYRLSHATSNEMAYILHPAPSGGGQDGWRQQPGCRSADGADSQTTQI